MSCLFSYVSPGVKVQFSSVLARQVMSCAISKCRIFVTIATAFGHPLLPCAIYWVSVGETENKTSISCWRWEMLWVARVEGCTVKTYRYLKINHNLVRGVKFRSALPGTIHFHWKCKITRSFHLNTPTKYLLVRSSFRFFPGTSQFHTSRRRTPRYCVHVSLLLSCIFLTLQCFSTECCFPPLFHV